METTAQGAKTWVHVDVREYNSKFVLDTFFCTSHIDYKGEKIIKLMKGT